MGTLHILNNMSSEGIKTIILCKDEEPAKIMDYLEYLKESTIRELMQFHGTKTNEDLAIALSLSK